MPPRVPDDFGATDPGSRLPGCMRAPISVSLLSIAACNSVVTPLADSGVDVDALAGADAPSRACDPTRPFGPPTAVVGINTNRIDMVGRLSPDELTIYFQSDRDAAPGGTVDLYVATRAPLGTFGTPIPLANVNTSDNDGDVSVSADGLTLYASRSPAAFDRGDLRVATRSSVVGAFGVPVLATLSRPTGYDIQPFDAGDALWFASDRPGGLGAFDIYRAPRTGSALGTPVPVAGISSAAEEWLPMLSFDRLSLYFSSTRPDAAASGMFDIWRSTRPDVASAFSAPQLVPELNSAFQDFPSWISPDGCRIYLSSERLGSADIYVAERQP